ncbi:MAG: rRNA maturation RNase YbeY [Anaerolineae bacterium]|nr:MAG: rRNA maturation RNase YbeY [Anaerolineae bacterium]
MQQFKINVDFTGPPDNDLIGVIEEAALATFNLQQISKPVSVNVLISDNQFLRELNYKYRGYDRATDVLAFPMDENVAGLEGLIGDMAISLEAAGKQAREARHSVISELQLLVVHGCLHLLGYDHVDEDDKKEMWAAQTSVLNKISSEIHFPASG